MSATELGLDRSGNGNNFSFENALGSDQMLDTPTNNFCTMNTLDAQTADKMSEGNLFVDAANRCCGTMAVSSGKWYFEVRLHYQHHGGLGLGIREIGGAIANDTGINQVSMSHPVGSGVQLNIVVDGSSSTDGEVGTVANGQIIGIMFDVDAQTITFKVDNGAIHSSLTNFDYSACSNMGTVTPFFSIPGGRQVIANFGQDSSFAGNEVAQGNQDSNDIGDFYYEPPSDYLALCTSNLPEPAVKPAEHFNTVLYTGNDNDNHAITGVGFQPDFLWIKNRGTTDIHELVDAVRGQFSGGNGLGRLRSNDTTAEIDSTIEGFTSDGFTLDGDNTGYNGNNANYVAWNWKANGSGSANTDGSINSTVSANTDAGFSIVSFTGTNSNGATIGHGLSKAPEMIIVKSRSAAGEPWRVYHSGMASDAETDYMNLNTDGAIADSAAMWADTAPTSSVFSVGQDGGVNANGTTYIAYCFHSVEGYSKLGFQVSNNSTDGAFINTGFQPKFIFHRGTFAADWTITDNEREAGNPFGQEILFPNGTNAETTYSSGGVDFVSNGFKVRTRGDGVHGANSAGARFIYMAFAKTPFKYSNAR